jgi:hypothetical protein
MHAYNLRRQLQQAEDRSELRRIGDGLALPVAWVYRALIQLAVEWVMAESLLRMAVADDTYRAQLQIDCLYGISDAWQSGDPLPPYEGTDGPLKMARTELLRYLKNPRALREDITTTLDRERLEWFYRGEQKPQAAGHGPSWLATRKYSVLVEVCDEGVRPMLDGGDRWLVSPFGYPVQLTAYDAGTDERVQGFTRLLHDYRSRGWPEADFALLWDVNEVYPFDPVHVAVDGVTKRPDDPEARATVSRYAPMIPAACQLVNVLALGWAVLRAIRPVVRAEAVRLLRRGI